MVTGICRARKEFGVVGKLRTRNDVAAMQPSAGDRVERDNPLRRDGSSRD
jgi:hypothetical protein